MVCPNESYRQEACVNGHHHREYQRVVPRESRLDPGLGVSGLAGSDHDNLPALPGACLVPCR